MKGKDNTQFGVKPEVGCRSRKCENNIKEIFLMSIKLNNIESISREHYL
jgi:hypothetical protein